MFSMKSCIRARSMVESLLTALQHDFLFHVTFSKQYYKNHNFFLEDFFVEIMNFRGIFKKVGFHVCVLDM